jgi:hypothetical protein
VIAVARSTSGSTPSWLDTLNEGLAAAGAEELDMVSTAALGDRLVALCRCADLIQAEIARGLVHFESRGGPRHEGVASTVAGIAAVGALAIDAALVATGHGDWKALAVDAALMVVPGADDWCLI